LEFEARRNGAALCTGAQHVHAAAQLCLVHILQPENYSSRRVAQCKLRRCGEFKRSERARCAMSRSCSSVQIQPIVLIATRMTDIDAVQSALRRLDQYRCVLRINLTPGRDVTRRRG